MYGVWLGGIVMGMGLAACHTKPRVWKPIPSKPLQRAHAHNDYLHGRPLYDALAHRFMSVEADVHKVKDSLLVAHWWWNRDPKRTLRGLYLDPLFAQFQKHKGSVYPQKSSFYLLVDVKTDGLETYQLLHKTLRRYRKMLTEYTPTTTKQGAVTVIISGNRPLAYMQKQKLRWAAYDGRPGDLDKSYSPHLVPLISEKWSSLFAWRGDRPMPPNEQKRLRAYVAKVHQQGRMVRFWATPDGPGAARDAFWKILLQARVDWINTDDLTGLQHFLLKQRPFGNKKPALPGEQQPR